MKWSIVYRFEDNRDLEQKKMCDFEVFEKRGSEWRKMECS